MQEVNTKDFPDVDSTEYGVRVLKKLSFTPLSFDSVNDPPSNKPPLLQAIPWSRRKGLAQ